MDDDDDDHQKVAYGNVLCADVLKNIAERLTGMEEFCAFSLSSTLFKEAAPLDNFKGLYLRRNVPYLMLPPKDDDGIENEFFSLAKEKVVAKTTLSREEKGKRRIESQGWLLMFGGYPEKSISLVNPFKHVEIRLPDEEAFLAYGSFRRTETYEYIHNMVLSSSDFELVVIYGFPRYLGFWKPGNQKWITKKEIPSGIQDVTYCNDQFFTIDFRCQVSVLDVRGQDLIMEHVVRSLPCLGNQCYIVGSSGMLLVVSWRQGYTSYERERFSCEDVCFLFEMNARDRLIYEGRGFDIFEVNPVTKSWKKIKDLGGKAIFIGSNSATLLVDATQGIKANHIYHAGAPWLHDKGAFVYGLEDGNLVPLDIGNSFRPMFPPTWIAPSF